MANEEMILATLEYYEKILKSQTKILEKQETMLAQQNFMLKLLQIDVSSIKAHLDVAMENRSHLDTQAPKSRVEQLEDEMAFLKSIIKSMSRDIAELQKAQ